MPASLLIQLFQLMLLSLLNRHGFILLLLPRCPRTAIDTQNIQEVRLAILHGNSTPTAQHGVRGMGCKLLKDQTPAPARRALLLSTAQLPFDFSKCTQLSFSKY